MKLTESNYYSKDMNKAFCSVSQLKSFIGTPHQSGCEFRAMAELNGEYVRPTTSALLQGSYVDTALTEPENLETFKEAHPEMFSSRGATKGLLKSEFIRCNQMVERVKKDKWFMHFMTGEHQKIMVGEIFGLPFKIKMDTYRKGKFISDLKTVEGIHKGYWNPLTKSKCDFIDYFDYMTQGAIYQEIVYQNTGERLPFIICAVSKEEVTDFELIRLKDDELHSIIYGDELREGLASKIESIRLLKSGEVEPCKCGSCSWCKKHKKLRGVIWKEELGGILD